MTTLILYHVGDTFCVNPKELFTICKLGRSSEDRYMGSLDFYL